MPFRRFYFLFFLIAIVIFGILISWYTYRSVKEQTVASLTARTDTVAQLVDEKSVSSLSFSSADLDNPTYKKLKQQFMAARAVNSDVRFIYILAEDASSTIRFVVDSESPDSINGYSPPGEPYPEAQPIIFNTFATGKSVVEDVYTDSYGKWVTGLSPIKDENGVTKYLLGIDIDASDFTKKPYIESTFPFMLSLVLLILALAVYVVRRKEVEFVDTRARFISLASHELRSPLTGIRWSAENLLKHDDLPDDKRTVLKAIHESALHLLSVINDLLSVSVAEHDFVDKKSFVVLNVKDLVKDAIEDLSSSAASLEVRVEIDMSPDDLKVKGNTERLKNLFSNLISNAIKYSHKEGIVSIAVGMHSSMKGKMVRVAIRDSGIGIPKDDLKKVSQGFYRAENAKVHTINGTGLGLNICFKIAERHGGNLTIESIQDEGTMAIVSLPFYTK